MSFVQTFKYKTLPILAVAAMATGCTPEIEKPTPQPPSPPPPEPVVIKTNVDNIDGVRSIVNIQKKDNTSYEFTVGDVHDVTVDSDNYYGAAKTFDTVRDDVKITWAGKISYVDETVLGFDSWQSDTGSHPIMANRNNNWPQTNGDAEQFATAGYPNIKNIVYDVRITVTREQARDFEFTKKLLEQHPAGPIYMTGADSMHLYINDLINYNTTNITTGGRIFASDMTVAIVRANNETADETMHIRWGIGAGTNRSAEYSWDSTIKGVIPQFQLSASDWPDNSMVGGIDIGESYVQPENIVQDYIRGNWSSAQHEIAMGDFILLSPDVFPLGQEVDFYRPSDERYIKGGLVFGWDQQKFAFAAYLVDELNEMLMPLPKYGVEPLRNCNLVKDWLKLNKILPYNQVPDNNRVAKTLINYTSEEMKEIRKERPEIKAVVRPEWARDITPPTRAAAHARLNVRNARGRGQ
jgi:hypothetical protein